MNNNLCKVFAIASRMQILSSQHAHSILKKHMKSDIEEVWCMALTSSLKLIDIKMIFRGTVDQCTIHPRDIFRFACNANASRIILAHNHPSGDLEPSKQDILITKQILNCSKIIQIPLLDHLIITSKMYFSFADQELVFETHHTEITHFAKTGGVNNHIN